MSHSAPTNKDGSETTDQQKPAPRAPSRRLSFAEFAEALAKGEVNLDVPMKVRKREPTFSERLEDRLRQGGLLDD